jgi:hypothetical protein
MRAIIANGWSKRLHGNVLESKMLIYEIIICIIYQTAKRTTSYMLVNLGVTNVLGLDGDARHHVGRAI